MKVGELIQLLARHPSYADVSVFYGEADLSIADADIHSGMTGRFVRIDVDPIDPVDVWSLCPEEPNEEMIEKGAEISHLPPALCVTVWRAMFAAVDD